MITLDNQQTERVLASLQAHVGSDRKLKNEMFDHWCSYVETHMDSGASFEQAFSKLKEEFGVDELKYIEKAYLTYYQPSPWVGILQRAGSIAAMLVLLAVAGVDAQKRPDISPVFDQYIVSSAFGEQTHPITNKEIHHNGIDLRVPLDTPVRSTADGTVKTIKNSPKGYGLHIIISHEDGYDTLYANLSSVSVDTGQTVEKGEEIGRSGNSGTSSAPHLHYEIRLDQKPVNPKLYISK